MDEIVNLDEVQNTEIKSIDENNKEILPVLKKEETNVVENELNQLPSWSIEPPFEIDRSEK